MCIASWILSSRVGNIHHGLPRLLRIYLRSVKNEEMIQLISFLRIEQPEVKAVENIQQEEPTSVGDRRM